MGQFHVFFFPMMAQGHIIPTLDMAKLFVYRGGAKATVITTPLNLPSLTKSIQETNHLGMDISVRAIPFPAAEAGLPEGCERIDQVASEDLIPNFFRATAMLQEPLERLLQEVRPTALVADMFFPWATAAAAKFDIPRLVFHGISYFALCAAEVVRRHRPHRSVASDSEPFLVPHLPHEIRLTRSQLAPHDRKGSESFMAELHRRIKESEARSFGVVVNSVYELEADYAEYYGKVLGKRAWHIGPLLRCCDTKIKEKAAREEEIAAIAAPLTPPSSDSERPTRHDCLKWLDSKKPNSVIYICFGSMSNFTASQLRELAMGLEASGHQFIWVVRKGKDSNDKEGDEGWLPEGYEARVEGKGLIVRGWAPQVLVLDHGSTGAFMTHCGWNSTLEGICAGVPMVTWPLYAEQFFNEKLVCQVLEVGVGVGAKQWSRVTDGVKGGDVAAAVKRVMSGQESEELRGRARSLKEKALRAIEPGGSSISSLDSLLHDLTTYNKPSPKVMCNGKVDGGLMMCKEV
ncbi:unnamed protein product [Cuscuta campestris]|uniref:Glycosyltransferase n=1 Tax=Cuscuta campestris TaxID=132261 RepID=A0A484L7B7_9ASTE|nr:unnamed protein product [Cuscuta campestris]